MCGFAWFFTDVTQDASPGDLVQTLAERGMALEQVVEDQIEVAFGRRGELNPVPHGSVACA